MNLLNFIGRLLMTTFLFVFLEEFVSIASASTECESCGQSHEIDIGYFAFAVTENGLVTVGLNKILISPPPNPTDQPIPTLTGKGTHKALKNKIYEGTATAVSSEFSGSSDAPFSIFFAPKSCELALWVQYRFTSDGTTWTDWTQWEKRHDVSISSTLLYLGGGYTIEFKIKLLKNGEDGNNDKAAPGPGGNDPSTGGGAAGISTGVQDIAPVGGTQPSSVTPATFSSQLDLGSGVSGSSAGSVRLAGTIATILADVSNLKVLDPETEDDMAVVLHSGNPRQIFTSVDLIDVQPVDGGGVELKYYAPGNFVEDDGEYLITGEAFKIVRYLPLDAVSGQHLGGIRTVVESVQGTTYTRDVVKTVSDGQSYRVIDEGGLRVIDVDTAFDWIDDEDSEGDAPGDYWQKTDLVVEHRSGILFSKVQNTYRYLVRRAGSPSEVVESYQFLTQNLTFTTDTTSLATNYVPDLDHLGQAKSVTNPDGSWEAYTYYSGTEGGGVEAPMRGLLKEIMRPWNGSPASPSLATSSNCECTLLEYGNENPGESYFPVRRTTTAPSESGTKTIRKWEKFTTPTTILNDLEWLLRDCGIHEDWLPDASQVELEAGKTFASSSEAIQKVIYTYNYPGDGPDYPWNGRTLASLDGTGSGTVTGYQMGGINETSGEFDPTADPEERACIQSVEITMRAETLVPNETIRVVTLTDLQHRVLQRETSIFLGIVDDVAEWSPASLTTYDYSLFWADGSIREVVVEQDGRIVRVSEQTSGLQESYRDEQGIETVTIKDLIGRTISVTQTGVETSQEELVTSFAYSGRTTTTTRLGGSLSLSTIATQDLAGRTISESDESGAITIYEYPDGGRDSLKILPGGLTSIVTRSIGGAAVSKTGTSLVATFYSRNVDSDGNIILVARSGSSDSPRYVKTVTDWAGRKIGEVRPSPTGSGEVTETHNYYAGTNEISSIASDATTTASSGLSVATFLSEVPDWTTSLRISGYSASSASSLTMDSHDQITESLEYYELASSRWWHVSEHRVYDSFDGSSTSTAMVTKTKRCLKGDLVKTIQILPSGEEISVTTTFNRTTKTRTDTTDTNRSTLDAVATNVNGLTTLATSHVSSVAAQWIHDGLGRVVREISPTGAVTRTGYRLDGKVEGTTDHYGASTRYDYYGPTHASAGRVSKVTHPDGNTTTYKYYPTGKIEEIAGSASYKTTYGYDGHGALETLGTWRTGAGADVTTWTYQDGTGLLSSKTDAADESIAYTYHPSGTLNRRTWARGVYTDYLWDRLGNLTSKNYSDSTPDVSFSSYDRLGRPVGVNTVGIANETFSYHNGRGLLGARFYDTNTTNSPYLAGRGVQYVLDATGRVETINETSGGSSLSAVRSIEHDYDSSGRFWKVTDGGQVHTYGYKSDSNQIETIHSSDGTTDWFRETQYRDATGRLLGNLSQRMSGGTVTSTIARHGYKHDAAGRRKEVRLLDGSKWEYGYNYRSEVETATRKDPSGNPITQLGANYTYDGIGNRLTANSAVLGNRTYVTPNELNQYDEITMDDERTAIGRAPVTMDVKVNDTDATRIDELYYRTLTASNSSTPAWQQVVTRDSDNDPTVTSHFWYDPATLNPEYDEDGNLENDGRWFYTWDAENRLVKMETTDAAETAGHPETKLVFKYDWQGRRLARTVYRGTSSTHESTRRWLYDGWNPILECLATSEATTGITRLNTLTWGLDLSGNLRGAGGVGGLITQIAVSGGAIYKTAYDGSGNVVAWTKSGQSTAQWKSEYDAFGNPIAAEGTNPSEYGFSTKIRDPYTGLSYYGYRYYDSVTGRWASKDPIGEKGGLNIYSLGSNDTVNQQDVLGLRPGDLYDSRFRALFQALDDAFKLTQINGFENCGWVIKIQINCETCYSYTPPDNKYENTPAAAGKNIEAVNEEKMSYCWNGDKPENGDIDYHTHGQPIPGDHSPEQFSEGDMDAYDEEVIDGAVATPEGRIAIYYHEGSEESQEDRVRYYDRKSGKWIRTQMREQGGEKEIGRPLAPPVLPLTNPFPAIPGW
jgi:RHS repeat-associated protein